MESGNHVQGYLLYRLAATFHSPRCVPMTTVSSKQNFGRQKAMAAFAETVQRVSLTPANGLGQVLSLPAAYLFVYEP